MPLVCYIGIAVLVFLENLPQWRWHALMALLGVTIIADVGLFVLIFMQSRKKDKE